MKPNSQQVVVEIQDAVVSYREDVALKGVSISVTEGEFVGIIGPNGAGKTTLLTLINGLGNLLHGKVFVLGKKLKGSNIKEIRKAVGYVPQVLNIDPRMPIRVFEVVMIGRYGKLGFIRRPSQSDWQVVDEAMELVEIAHLKERPIGHLSGGEQQKVSIARALAQEPKILLLDEPTSDLDLRARGNIVELVKKIHCAKNLTTFFVTHNVNHVPNSCTRLILMKAGRILGDGPVDVMLTEALLTELYESPVNIIKHNGELIITN